MKKTLFALLALITLPSLASAQGVGAPPAEPEPKVVEKPFVYTPEKQDILIGSAKAPVTIVEYASMSCPHCAHFYKEILPELKKKYIDTGKVRLVFRHEPLNAPALQAAKLIACVPSEQKETFLKVLFTMQDKWAFDFDATEGLAKIAGVGGVERTRFDKCEGDKVIEKEILDTAMTANQNGWVKSTPTFFIGTAVKLEGARPVEEFQKAIDPLLKK